MGASEGLLSIDDLTAKVEAGQIDTVLVAFSDMQGRLQGKRCARQVLPRRGRAARAEGCNYLLAVDVDMNTVDGYAMSSWDTGTATSCSKPDLRTLRRVPWHEGTALVLCDLQWEDGKPVAASPRQVLRRQLDRLAERGLAALRRHRARVHHLQGHPTRTPGGPAYRELQPANQYNVDYSMIGTGRIEPLLRRIRNEMAGAGMYVESAKGECNLGQHEIAFRYADALTTCDNHSIYKTGAKEIADQEGMSLTFMAKYDQREGNSCHIHISLRSTDGDAVLAGDGASTASRTLMEHFLAGQLASMRELTYLFAPNVNSYKRFVAGQLRPDRDRLGPRQPDLRAAGRRPRRSRCGWRTGCRAETSTPTSPSPLWSPPGWTASSGSLRSNRPSRATPTPPTSHRCLPRCATPRSCFAESKLAVERVRRRRGRALPQCRAGRAGRFRRRRHRLGEIPWLRAALTDRRERRGPRHRLDHLPGTAHLLGLGQPSSPCCRDLRRHGRRRPERRAGLAPAGARRRRRTGDGLDGLVFSGGSDIDPAPLWRAAARVTWNTRPLRDDWRARAAARALDRDLPVLGVCRGAQLMNVARAAR